MGEQLSALDATFLELEEIDQSAHMHIGGVMVLEPHPGGAPPLEQIRRDVIAGCPTCRATPNGSPTPGRAACTGPPGRRTAISGSSATFSRPACMRPGGRDELMEWAGEYYSQRLDRTKPLWEIAVLELADGRWALVTKTHHCMIDGVGSVDLATTLLDTERERPERGGQRRSSNGGAPARASAEIETVAEPEPTTLQRGVAASPIHTCRSGTRPCVRPSPACTPPSPPSAWLPTRSRARDAFRRSKAFAELIVRDELIAAPHTQPERPIGAERTALRAHHASSTS